MSETNATSQYNEEHVETLRRRAEELTEQCEKYDRIIERSPICTKIISLDRKLEFMSCAGHIALKIPDITVFYGKTYPPPGFDEDLSKLYDEHFPRALNGEHTFFECPIPDMEGKREWYITHLIPMRNPDGELEFVLATSANITARKNAEFEAEKLNNDLVRASRIAGMAEVATGVLHNVGNTLNSVTVATDLVSEQVKNSKLAELGRVVKLLEEHKDDLAAFLTDHPQGAAVLPYLLKLVEVAEAERESTLEEAKRISARVGDIRLIIGRQQQYAKNTIVGMKCSVKSLVEASLGLVEANGNNDGVQFVVALAPDLPEVFVDKHLTEQILVNILKNAKESTELAQKNDKTVRVEAGLRGNECFYIRVEDDGVGIPHENMEKIFQYGFSTKEGGHGFGLHNATNAAEQLGGAVTCHSDGPQDGAVFTLELPLHVKLGQEGGDSV